MRKHATPLTRSQRRGEVCVVEGYDVRVSVRHGRLVVVDGIADERRERVYSRATAGISRLVILGHGMLTTEAIHWCADVGVALIHIDRDGRVLATSAGGSGDSRLRRAQALARSTEVSLEIARGILRRKLDGQQQVLTQLGPTRYEFEAFAEARADLESADTIERLVWAERDAALAYWSAWADIETRFRASDAARVPANWLRFEQRTSPLTAAPRLAANPLNATLNYLYALLVAETRIACLIVGLDPGLGLVHADYRARDSFVLDLMEAGRPAVDKYVLDLARERVFNTRDFGETRRGACRLASPLARELASTTTRWRRVISPVVEDVAAELAGAPDARIGQLPSPLTGSRRSAAQDRKRRPRSTRGTTPMPACKRCGAAVPSRDRTYCDACAALPQEQRYASTLGQGSFSVPGTDDARVAALAEDSHRTSRRCRRCGGPVSHRKRVLCDSCFIAFRAELAAQRRPCKQCSEPTPHRKRALCDRCLAERIGPRQR